MTIIDFNNLNLREARLKKHEKNAPAAWSAVLDCGHQHVLSDAAIHQSAEKKYTGDLHYCDKCPNGDRSGTGDHGFCTPSVMHPIVMAIPLFGRQIPRIMTGSGQEQQHEQQ